MYTSYIGKKFLRIYNEKENKNLTAKEFFDEQLFPLFFNNEKHLMHVGNSPFFQPPNKDLVNKGYSKSEAQFETLKTNIENETPNMSIFVGYSAKDINGTTSGQVTSLDCKISENEMYASWIGQSLAIGVSGGFVFAIDDEEILLEIFKGAKLYRDFLNKTPNVKDKQIETWNGHWVNHIFSNEYDSVEPWNDFQIKTESVQGNIAIPTKNWSQVIFALSKKYKNQSLIVYAYNLSQTNTTLGFIQIYFAEFNRLFELRDKIFIDKEKSILSDKEIEILEPFYTFKNACQAGTIGLKSIEPRGLREYLPKGTYIYTQGKEFKITENNYKINLIYKLWMVAMLNKTELLVLAEKIAKSIIENEKNDGENNRGKTVKTRETNKILESKSVKNFIENLTENLQNNLQNAEIFKEVIKEVLIMPLDNFPLFIALIKFEYQYQKSIKE